PARVITAARPGQRRCARILATGAVIGSSSADRLRRGYAAARTSTRIGHRGFGRARSLGAAVRGLGERKPSQPKAPAERGDRAPRRPAEILPTLPFWPESWLT